MDASGILESVCLSEGIAKDAEVVEDPASLLLWGSTVITVFMHQWAQVRAHLSIHY